MRPSIIILLSRHIKNDTPVVSLTQPGGCGGPALPATLGLLSTGCSLSIWNLFWVWIWGGWEALGNGVGLERRARYHKAWGFLHHHVPSRTTGSLLNGGEGEERRGSKEVKGSRKFLNLLLPKTKSAQEASQAIFSCVWGHKTHLSNKLTPPSMHPSKRRIPR